MTLPGETIGTGALGPDDDPSVTPLQVMHSWAGYYIGTGYIESDGHEVPYTRESNCYFDSFETASKALTDDSWPRRTLG